MATNAIQSWEEFLNPEITRPRLIAASIYIACFEALKKAIESRIREFFWIGFDESGDMIDPRYQAEVLSRNRSPVYASLDWLKEMNAINDTDMQTFERVKSCRNTLAHELLSMLGNEGLPSDFDERFTEMVLLFRKIEVWWVANVEIPSNSDFDGSDIDEKEIIPGRIMTIQLLLDIALGDEEQSKHYYNEFRKQHKGG